MSSLTTTPIVFVQNPDILSVSAPILGLYAPSGTDTPQSVVSGVAQTIKWNYDPNVKNPVDTIDVSYTFELLSALLDTAPTQASTGTTLFTVTVKLPDATYPTDTYYYIDATIQTKGNSALSPTYRTQPFILDSKTTKVYGLNFPVTNFFNVSAPGAPYTLFLYIQRQRPGLPPKPTLN